MRTRRQGTGRDQPVDVLIDAHVFEPRGRGMSHFAARFLEGLAATPCELRIAVLSRFPERLPGGPSLRYLKIPDAPAPLWEQVILPWLLRRYRPRILHALANTLPVLRPADLATVVTLHDVIFMHPDPEISAGKTFVQKIGKLYRTWVCNRTIPGCDKVLTISDHSKGEIERFFPAQRGRVEVAHQGPSLTAPLAPATKRGPYVLLPGGNHPRKNVRRAVEAFLRFRQGTGAPWTLLVFGVGPGHLDLEEFRRQWGAREVQAIQLLGYVGESELPGLFQGAEIVFFPSLEEGFGIPLLDALALGRPAVTSRVSALPEIGGDAAVYVDPRSIEDMSAALERLYRDGDLRRSMAGRAQVQAEKFRWEDLTARTLAVYRGLALGAVPEAGGVGTRRDVIDS